MATIERHWKSLLNGKKVGEVTRDDINQIFYDKEVMKHASRSVRGIGRANPAEPQAAEAEVPLQEV